MAGKEGYAKKALLIVWMIVILCLVGCQEALTDEEEVVNQYFNLIYTVETDDGLTSQSAILSEAKAKLFELEKIVGSDLQIALIQSETLNDVLQYAALNDYALRITDVVLDEVDEENGRMVFDYTVNLGVVDASGNEKHSAISGVIALERDGERWMVHGDTGLDFPSEWRENRLESVELENDGDTLDEP